MKSLSVSAMPAAGSFRGHLFERQVLKHFSNIGARDFPIRGLTPRSDQTTWIYRGRIDHTIFRKSTVIDAIMKAVENKQPLHLVPSVPNFPAVNSILYDPNDPDAVLTCIQITINVDHDIVVSGLQDIQSWLKRGTSLSDLRPTRSRRWRFLFVVPSDMASTFKVQSLYGDTGKGEWAKKVDQYVLGLEERNIFEKIRFECTEYSYPATGGATGTGVEYLSLSTADEFGMLCRFR